VLLAMGDDDIAVPAAAAAPVRPQVSVLLAMGDDDIVVPVMVMAQVQPRTRVPLAAGDDDIAAPILTLARAPATKTLEPLILAAAHTGTMHDATVAERPAAMPEARPVAIAAMPQPAVRPVLAEPAAAPAAPVIVASAETSYRRVALVASDTPVWPAPVKLDRVERRMPVIMFDRKGGIFHL
jgi:hypothetical protein